MEIQTFDKGLARLLELVSSVEGPKFVAIHAPGQNQGKTYLAGKLQNGLYKAGVYIPRILTDVYMNEVTPDSPRGIQERGCIYEEGACCLLGRDLEVMDKRNIELFGKPIDYHVAIWNPNMFRLNVEGLEKNGALDMLIRNPNSTRKVQRTR